MQSRRLIPRALALCTVLAAPCTNSAAQSAASGDRGFSPYAGSAHPTRLLWGDTHLHSSLSTDAFGFGVRLGPEQAFRFASGEEVTSTGGLPARLGRALDFVVLADHAESLGMMERVRAGDPDLMRDQRAREWHDALTGSPEQQGAFRRLFASRETREAAFAHLDELATAPVQHSIWQDTLATAERFNRPGSFTTLLGFEWTAAPGGSNLHRVVVFRDAAERVARVLPLSSMSGEKPEDLWRYLADYESATGGRVLAIPHNGNLSNGLMFPLQSSFGGTPIDGDYATTRARWEPVVEVTQIKGDGETHPLLSPDDEFADYETWDRGNFEGVPKTNAMLPFEYARSALGTGLQIEARTGTNPYRFGMIGSTDSHTALSAVEENNFFGKHSGVEPTPERWKHVVGKAGDQTVLGWQQAASGYAAVWASDNTREALWDALRRREVYASTGPRITVRFFGGWGYSDDALVAPDLAGAGYAGGVPMGGELRGAGKQQAPRFLVAAARDPIGANLDRIQIVKGWIDADGKTNEHVYDVAWSAGRTVGADGKLAAVGNTVDIKAATWRNSIGAGELQTLWEDPDFDPARNAFYYARVLEIPTPRWTAYDARRFGAEMPPEVPMVTRERAYTSPIWYRP